jgi:hypothetical protein
LLCSHAAWNRSTLRLSYHMIAEDDRLIRAGLWVGFAFFAIFSLYALVPG